MAAAEHVECANIIKNTHSSLRKLASRIGFESAWQEHCSKQEGLKIYADAMKRLGTKYWEENSADPTKLATSRIKWVAEQCYAYYFCGGITEQHEKEAIIAEKLGLSLDMYNKQSHDLDGIDNLNVIDVGSCYNPFDSYDFLNVLPVDLFPADTNVFQCDFTKVKISDRNLIKNQALVEVKENCYDVVIFCLLLEYLPSSSQRKTVCENAYKVLKTEGLLAIVTPDSKHVGANAKVMKNWRYTLALMGYSRIKYEKLQYLHCMIFRKSLHLNIANRWATLYKEPYMQNEICIPQDFLKIDKENNQYQKTDSSKIENETIVDLFDELPNLDGYD